MGNEVQGMNAKEGEEGCFFWQEMLVCKIHEDKWLVPEAFEPFQAAELREENGGFWEGAKKFELKKFMCFFSVPY